MKQAYVAYEGISPEDRKAGGCAPCHERHAWVCFCFDGTRLVVDYAFCEQKDSSQAPAERRAIACAAEWRDGASWALRRAAA